MQAGITLKSSRRCGRIKNFKCPPCANISYRRDYRRNRDLRFFPSFPVFLSFPLSSPSFASRESQVVKSYYPALRDQESYVSLTCFTAWKGTGCLLEKHAGKHRSLCGNKVRSAARICTLDERDPISSAAKIVSRGRAGSPIFLRDDRKGRGLVETAWPIPTTSPVDKLRKTFQTCLKLESRKISGWVTNEYRTFINRNNTEIISSTLLQSTSLPFENQTPYRWLILLDLYHLISTVVVKPYYTFGSIYLAIFISANQL